MVWMSARVLRTLTVLFLAASATPLVAQQTGSISGKVTTTDGSLLPGVTVEAQSNVRPGPRVTVTGTNGEYRLPALPPGSYTVKFELSGMQSVTRKAAVQLGLDTVADATLGPGITENITVTAETSVIDKDSATVASALSNDQILSLPLAQEYRDLVKLIPGVQYTQDQIRGLETITSQGNYVAKWHGNPQGLTGIGLTPGMTYHFTGVTQDLFTTRADGFPTTYTFVNHAVVTGPGPGNNFLVSQTYKVTINGIGDFVVELDRVKVECL